MSSGIWQKSWWQPPRYNGFKVLALLLSLFVWAYVTANQNPLVEATYSVPVEIRNLAENLAQPETNYQVQVRVQGISGVIDELSSYNFVAYVDLTDMQAGEATPEVVVDPPDHVSLISRSPESIPLTLEEKVSASFNIEVKLNGEPAESYNALEPVLSPELITLSGSEAHIAEVGSVYVPADISGLSANYSKNQAVEVLSTSGENISEYFAFAPSSVSLLVPIVFDQPEADLPVRGLTTGLPGQGHLVSRTVVEPSTVRVFGSLEKLEAIYYLETEAVNISGLTATTSFTARLQAPEGVSLAQETVTVVVQIEAVDVQTFTCYLSELRNLDPSLSCRLDEVSCQVTLAGTATHLATATAEDIHLYLDFSDITAPGVYEIPLRADLPANLSLESADPAWITVELQEEGSEGSEQLSEPAETDPNQQGAAE